ncbi:MAG TPA: hypothetical protein VGE52_04110, partial [Pirellulales bacterium]
MRSHSETIPQGDLRDGLLPLRAGVPSPQARPKTTRCAEKNPIRATNAARSAFQVAFLSKAALPPSPLLRLVAAGSDPGAVGAKEALM